MTHREPPFAPPEPLGRDLVSVISIGVTIYVLGLVALFGWLVCEFP